MPDTTNPKIKDLLQQLGFKGRIQSRHSEQHTPTCYGRASGPYMLLRLGRFTRDGFPSDCHIMSEDREVYLRLRGKHRILKGLVRLVQAAETVIHCREATNVAW